MVKIRVRALHLITFIFFALASHKLEAQNEKADSLKIVLDTTSDVALKIKILNYLTNQYLYLSTDTSIYYVDQALQLAKANHLEKELGISYRLKGVINFFSGNLNTAMIYYDSSLVLRKKLQDVQGEVLLLNNIAFAHQRLGNQELSKAIFLDALAIAEQHKLEQDQADICNNLGLHYRNLSNYDSAMYFYQKSLNINMSLENTSETALLKSNIATIDFDRNDILTAFLGFKSAYDFAIESNNNRVKKLALLNIGVIFDHVGLHQNAIAIYQELLNYYHNDVDQELNEFFVYYNLANAYRTARKFDEAINTFTKVEAEINSSEAKDNSRLVDLLSKTYTFLALSYSELGHTDNAEKYFLKAKSTIEKTDAHTKGLYHNGYASYLIEKGDFIQSNNLLLETIEINGIDSFPDILQETYQMLAEIAEGNKMEAQSITYREKHEHFTQIVENRKRSLETIRSAIEFDNERRDLALQLSQKEKQIIKSKLVLTEETRLKQIYSLCALIILIFGIWLWYSQAQKNKRNILEEKTERLRLSSENEKLRSESLTQELELKQKEVLSQALQLAQKNEAISELKEKLISEFKLNPSDGLQRSIQSIDNQISTEKDWESFRVSFESVYENFFDHLKTDFPELTPRELQLCSLLRLNMSIKKMSSLLGISEEGVKKARYRIRKKIKITDSPISLSSFLMKY